MPNSLLVLVLVLVQYFLVTWARWVPSTTTVTHGITTSPVRLGTFDEPEPRASATPWKRQVPISARQIASSSTPVASPSPTPTGIKLGQVVIASTRQSTLPSAICAIGPWSNGSKSALEIWGCSSGYLIGSDTLTFNSRDECISSDGRYFFQPYGRAMLSSHKALLFLIILLHIILSPHRIQLPPYLSRIQPMSILVKPIATIKPLPPILRHVLLHSTMRHIQFGSKRSSARL
ncbi:uncharacterized protein LY89DRAFT_402949 [Mollisia scopiformis]|uniref:Uncharacterized protein n=1 Tax=Mollisia scopiformis TaxID=149040 RepID=A0A132B2W1_MOLSC|nr:uncharacterized protein LY89DRAFT_402949 [Mollisia scopiformis]KUJ06671.1 hypothetical protein LY89DRAFT_402949 [Mollisia scopiformis]